MYNEDLDVLGLDMDDMLKSADSIPGRYYSAYRQLKNNVQKWKHKLSTLMSLICLLSFSYMGSHI